MAQEDFFTYALVVPFFLTNFLTWWVIFANLPNPRSNMWLRLNCFYSFIVDSKIKRLFSTLRQKIATGNRYRSLKIATKKQTRHLRVCLYEFFLEKMSDRKRLGLSLEKDGGYSKLIVFMSAVLSGFTFGLPGFLGALTVEVRGTTLGCNNRKNQAPKILLVETWRRSQFATSKSRYSSSLDSRISLCWFNGCLRLVS